MPEPRQQSTVVTISRHGIYDFRRRVYYYASWMRSNKGKKVCVFGDLLCDADVQVYAADTGDFIGLAQIKSNMPHQKIIVDNRRTNRRELAL